MRPDDGDGDGDRGRSAADPAGSAPGPGRGTRARRAGSPPDGGRGPGSGPGPADAREAGSRPAPAERIVRALRRRRERPSPGSDLGEPDRRAAVALVLRSGERTSPARSAGTGDAGTAAAAGARPPGGARRSPARGVVEARGRDEAAAPLFDRPLPPELGGVEALFIVRAEREGDPWSGQVGLPGGHAEAVDADLVQAALRELREETGLELARPDVLGRLDELRPRSERLPSVAVSPFVAWHRGGGRIDPGPEVAGHFWMTLAALEHPRHRTVLTFRRRGAYRVFPGVGHEQGVVWGLTFAILRRFLGLLPRASDRRPGPAVADTARAGTGDADAGSGG